MIARYAFRAIAAEPRFSGLFVLNLILGLYGFIALDAFKASIQRSLEANATELLTADLSVSSRRSITSDEEARIHRILGPNVQETTVLTLYSMVTGSNASCLGEITAIGPAYPLYGHLTLTHAGTVDSSTKKLILSEPAVWVSPELAASLRLHLGDWLRIGTRSFRVADVVAEDSAHGSHFFDLAPRLYIGREFLESTGLFQRGSVVESAQLFRLPPNQNVDRLAHALNQQLTDPGVNVETARESSAALSRGQDFLDDYLGLVALVALFLALLGSTYLFRSFLVQHLKEMALLISLGLASRRARTIPLLQLMLLGSTAALVASALAALSLPWMMGKVGALLIVSVVPTLRVTSVLIAIGIGMAGSVLVSLPLLVALRRIPPAMLFHETALDGVSNQPGSQMIAALPALLLGWGLSVWQAHSWFTGSVCFGGFLVSAATMMSAGWTLSRTVLPRWKRRDWASHLALRNILRHRFASLSIFTALGLGSLLMSVIPQVQKSLSQDFEQPTSTKVASLFLFDIQEEQLNPLERWATAHHVSIESTTPLIRGRLVSINGKPYEKDASPGEPKTREAERERRSRNRGFNLTYRAHRLGSETLVAGRDFSGRYTGDPASGPPAEVSVEYRFAQRLRMKLHDVLEFDVDGIAVRGTIVNFRKVNWSSFQPNFFIQFQPGVLEAAPKTYLAAVSDLSPDQRASFQMAVNRAFPTLSMIDISDLVRKILVTMNQMSQALRMMAILSVIAGLIVLYSIAQHQASLRQVETNLLKVLGAPFREIRRVFEWEFGLLSVVSCALGTLMSFAVSALLSAYLFDHVHQFSWRVPLAMALIIPIMSVWTIRLAVRRTLIQRPIALLQAES